MALNFGLETLFSDIELKGMWEQAREVGKFITNDDMICIAFSAAVRLVYVFTYYNLYAEQKTGNWQNILL
jgi:hypothetical protein